MSASLATWYIDGLGRTGEVAVAVLMAALLAFAVRPCGWLRSSGALVVWIVGVLAIETRRFEGLGRIYGLATAVALPLLLRGASGRGMPKPVPTRAVVLSAIPIALGAAWTLLDPGIEHAIHLFWGATAFLAADLCATEVGMRWGGRPR